MTVVESVKEAVGLGDHGSSGPTTSESPVRPERAACLKELGGIRANAKAYEQAW